MTIITAEGLKEIRAKWKMTQMQFAELLKANQRTYQDWEQGRVAVPPAIQAHVLTILRVKQIYEAWDAFAAPLAGTEEFDRSIDEHEKLWDELFPELCRL